MGLCAVSWAYNYTQVPPPRHSDCKPADSGHTGDTVRCVVPPMRQYAPSNSLTGTCHNEEFLDVLELEEAYICILDRRLPIDSDYRSEALCRTVAQLLARLQKINQ